MNTTHLIIVVPCYNEESVLPETIRQLSGVLNRMLENGKISIGKILFVDDGSKDKTWEIITEAGKTNGLVGGLKLALVSRPGMGQYTLRCRHFNRCRFTGRCRCYRRDDRLFPTGSGYCLWSKAGTDDRYLV